MVRRGSTVRVRQRASLPAWVCELLAITRPRLPCPLRARTTRFSLAVQSPDIGLRVLVYSSVAAISFRARSRNTTVAAIIVAMLLSATHCESGSPPTFHFLAQSGRWSLHHARSSSPSRPQGSRRREARVLGRRKASRNNSCSLASSSVPTATTKPWAVPRKSAYASTRKSCTAAALPPEPLRLVRVRDKPPTSAPPTPPRTPTAAAKSGIQRVSIRTIVLFPHGIVKRAS